MITFYYRAHTYDPLPESLEDYARWQTKIAKAGGLIGPACWIVQTYLQLRSRGYACRLTQYRPKDGIVVAHFDDMPCTRPERGHAYWVCVLADRQNAHPFANFYILQNPFQTLRTRQASAHVLHWKQPGIVARLPSRQALFTNVRFFGEHVSLAPEFNGSDFKRWCEKEGFDFQVVPRDRWHDYSECDVVLGVRGMQGSWVHDKPPSKLINAWVAGVPAILGRESSFRGIGLPNESYLEASSMDDVRRHLVALRDDVARRRSIVGAGAIRAAIASEDAVALIWIRTFDHLIKARADRWRRSGVVRVWHRGLERLLQGLAWRFRLIGTSFVDR